MYSSIQQYIYMYTWLTKQCLVVESFHARVPTYLLKFSRKKWRWQAKQLHNTHNTAFVSLEWESHTSKGLLLDNVLAAASLESGLVYCNTFRFFMQKSWTSCINNSWLQCARGETRARGNCVEGKIDLQESAMVKTRVPSVPACTSWYYEKHKNQYEKMTFSAGNEGTGTCPRTVQVRVRRKLSYLETYLAPAVKRARNIMTICCILMLVTKQKPRACCIVSGLGITKNCINMWGLVLNHHQPSPGAIKGDW